MDLYVNTNNRKVQPTKGIKRQKGTNDERVQTTKRYIRQRGKNDKRVQTTKGYKCFFATGCGN